jgi:Rhs element Vgr protein
LPISAGHREFAVKVDGAPLSREHQLLLVNVTKAANRISSARLVYADGAPDSGNFALSNAATFVPGAEVEILAGSDDDRASLFKGVVVRQSLKIRESTPTQLIVECRHKGFMLTVRRKSAAFFDQKDSEIMSSLINPIESEVETTTVSHPQQVQHQCTNWDFLLTRAEANGKLVYTNDQKVVVKAPTPRGSPKCTLQFGATIVEMDAEIDARMQFNGVKSVTWDAKQQAVVEKEAADPGIAGPGNLASGDLAKVAGSELCQQHHATVGEAEAQTWADAAWLKSRLSKVCGRVKCEGIGTINPGDVVTLAGVGERFSGNVFVTGVRHDFDLVQGWKSHIQFGSLERWFADEHQISATPAAGLLPGIGGLQIGKVAGNEDKDGEHRVRVHLALPHGDGDGLLARVAAVDAGEERGFFFRPEIGDEVVLGFLEDDPRQPVVLGMLHSSAKAAPLRGSDDNHEKIVQTRSKMKLYFNDEKKVMRLETPAGNKVTLSEDEKLVKLEDQNRNKIEMSADGIKIQSSKLIELKAGTEVKLESQTSFSAKGGTELMLKSNASAELSSLGEMKIGGATVKLN